ncbi:TnsA-like heteromeric transposase endonuclease subunit [soil metagenome]
MSDSVVVDADSAVVFYRPAVGEERSLPARDVSPAALLQAAPWRTFHWYFGQRHYSGMYWSATERGHVIYESRLEWANLLLADFDASVHRIAAPPFSLRAEVDGQFRRHVPDFLWDTDHGPVVVDVIRAERMMHPKIVLLCTWTKIIVESLGWSYLVVNEPSVIHSGNVRFLSGCRRDWLINQDLLSEIRSRRTQFNNRSIVDIERGFGEHLTPSVRPALMHLLWCHEYRVDMARPLRSSTVLEVSE